VTTFLLEIDTIDTNIILSFFNDSMNNEDRMTLVLIMSFKRKAAYVTMCCLCFLLENNFNLIVMVGDGAWDNGYGTMKPKNLISSILGGTPGKPKSIIISNPHDFRQVSFLFVVYFSIHDVIRRSFICIIY